MSWKLCQLRKEAWIPPYDEWAKEAELTFWSSPQFVQKLHGLLRWGGVGGGGGGGGGGGWDYNLEAGLWAGISSHTFSEAKENAIQSENHTISIYSVL